MESRLLEAEGIIDALRNQEVDAIIGDGHIAMVRLHKVEEALRQAKEELERRVVERTADLAGANRQLQEIIGEQRRTRRRLEESERKYRELVESANSIILRRSIEGRITFFNEYAQKLFGFREDEILGEHVVATIMPATNSRGADAAAELEAVSRSPEEYVTNQTETVCRDGRRLWISWTNRPIRDKNGRIVEILSVGNDITPLKTAEEALRETERRLLQAQQISHVGNWEWDCGNGALWWSDETYRLYGLEPGQVEPSNDMFLSFVHAEDRERIRNMIRDAMQNGRACSAEFRIVRTDGRERFMHCEAEMTVDAEGQIVRVMGITQDITERRQAQQQLERYTGQLRDHAELLDLAYDMIFAHDMEGRIIFWNRGAEQAYGWKREEALGQLSHELLQTEFSEPLIEITATIIREGRWEGEIVHTTRDGTKVTVSTRWALRRDADAKPVAILEIDNDITERKRAEQEMAGARRFAESIVHTIQECLVVLDPQLRVISANRSFHETFGTNPGQVEGRLFYALNDGQWDIPGLRDKLREVLPQDISFEDFEVECCGAGSKPRAFVLSARPICQQAYESAMILLVIQDITVRKQQEREIQTDRQQLSSLTEELLLIEERQRRQIATALHDSVGQSLAFAKRELALLKGKAPDEMRRSLDRVVEQVSDAIKQTRDLMLELSPSTLYAFGLQAAIEELAEQFSECEGFVCRVQASEEPKPVVEQVRCMLYRAVRELLVNVAKHAGARTVSIHVGRDERNIRITVRDDGKGFDPSVLANGRGREGGFGIFSVRERLTHMGGQFTLDSAHGRGTTVTLIAPLDLACEAKLEDVRADKGT
jgi:PAS domain S-box-containing protein